MKGDVFATLKHPLKRTKHLGFADNTRIKNLRSELNEVMAIIKKEIKSGVTCNDNVKPERN